MKPAQTPLIFVTILLLFSPLCGAQKQALPPSSSSEMASVNSFVPDLKATRKKFQVSKMTPVQKVLQEQLIAFGGVAGGGGDEDGIEFQRLAFEALENFRSLMPDEFKGLEAYDLVNAVTDTKVIVVDETLYVSIQGYSQESLAVNFPDFNTIVVNRPRWRSVTNAKKKMGIALHEIFSLKRIESTGSYTLSSKFMSRLGISQEEVADLRLAQTTVSKSGAVNLFEFIPGNYLKDHTGEGAYYDCRMRIGIIPSSNAATVSFSSCAGYGISGSIPLRCSTNGSMGPFCIGSAPITVEQKGLWGTKAVKSTEYVVFSFDLQKNAILTFYDSNGDRIDKSLAFLR